MVLELSYDIHNISYSVYCIVVLWGAKYNVFIIVFLDDKGSDKSGRWVKSGHHGDEATQLRLKHFYSVRPLS